MFDYEIVILQVFPFIISRFYLIPDFLGIPGTRGSKSLGIREQKVVVK